MRFILKNKLVFSGILSILVTGLIFALSQTSFFHRLHLKFANSLYQNNSPSEEIVIVALDDASFINKLSGTGGFLDISRKVYGDLITTINQQNPKVIAFDILFNRKQGGIKETDLMKQIGQLQLHDSETEKGQAAAGYLESFFSGNPADDHFAQAIEQSGRVALVGDAAITADRRYDPVKKALLVEEFDLPYTLFDPEQKMSGMSFLHADSDTVVRSFHPYFYSLKENKTLPHFSLRTLQTAFPKKQFDPPLENGRMNINFFGAPYSFKSISMGDVIDQKISPGDFKDKIVLVGVTSSIVHDEFLTPVSNGIQMPGVEIHANIIQTILDEQFLMNQGAMSRIITSAVLALAAALLIAYLNVWLSAALTILIAIGYVVAARQLYYQGLILNMIQPFLTLATTLVAMVIYRYFAELREKYKLHGALSHYVTPAVAAEVMKNPNMLSLGGQKREITVFFSDIANFTSISESMEPEALVQLINKYMDVMAREIMNAGGTVDKFEGDAIMAFFGAPVSNAQHAVQSCDAALRCQEALPSLNMANINLGLVLLQAQQLSEIWGLKIALTTRLWVTR